MERKPARVARRLGVRGVKVVLLPVQHATTGDGVRDSEPLRSLLGERRVMGEGGRRARAVSFYLLCRASSALGRSKLTPVQARVPSMVTGPNNGVAGRDTLPPSPRR